MFTDFMSYFSTFSQILCHISAYFHRFYVIFQYIFTDEVHRHIFTTRDYGKTISRQMVPFKPTKILFHKTNFSLVLGWDNSEDGTGDVSILSII